MKWDTPDNIKSNLRMYRKIRRLNISLCKQLESASSTVVMDKVKGSSCEYPYSQRSYSIIGVSHRKIELNQTKIKKGQSQMAEIEKFIDKIDDVIVKEAVKSHYMYGDTWQKVSMDLMGSRNLSTSSMMVYRYFENLCKLCKLDDV